MGDLVARARAAREAGWQVEAADGVPGLYNACSSDGTWFWDLTEGQLFDVFDQHTVQSFSTMRVGEGATLEKFLATAEQLREEEEPDPMRRYLGALLGPVPEVREIRVEPLRHTQDAFFFNICAVLEPVPSPSGVVLFTDSGDPSDKGEEG